jgi:DNA-binding SARP family transcriptional activator
MPVRIRVLGPIEVVVGRLPEPVPGRRARSLLAALVLGIDHLVSVEHLVAAVWGDDPPPSARNTLQTHVSTLRSLLGRDAIDFDEEAYILRLSPESVDAVRFERLTIEAADSLPKLPSVARELAMEGLGLWRGAPFGDIGDDEFVELEVRRLLELRLELMEVRLEADIALGRSGPAAAVLEGMVIDHPYRERLWCLLMTALAHDGRRVEAIRACRRLEDQLAEVGLEPSHEIRDLEQLILVEAPGFEAHLLHGVD